MSNKLFQGVIHQMKDAIDRVIGVIDENGVIIACSELVRIGEIRQGVRDELNYTSDVVTSAGYTYRPMGNGTKNEYIVFVEGEDKMAEKIGDNRNDWVYISHSACREDAEYVAGLVRERFGIQNVLIGDIGQVIGSHTGIGTVALFFVGDTREI